MKHLIIFLALICPILAGADWISKSDFNAHEIDNNFSINKYVLQNDCMTLENGICFNTPLDLRHVKPGFRAIAILQTADCLNSADCQSMIDNGNFACSNEVVTFDDKANWPLLDFVAESRPASGFFLWCEKEILVVDTTGSSAADAADTASAADQLTRDGAQGPRETSLQACVQDSKNPTLTPDQIKSCIAALVREVLGDKVNPVDL